MCLWASFCSLAWQGSWVFPLNTWARPQATLGRVSLGKGPTVLAGLPLAHLRDACLGSFCSLSVIDKSIKIIYQSLPVCWAVLQVPWEYTHFCLLPIASAKKGQGILSLGLSLSYRPLLSIEYLSQRVAQSLQSCLTLEDPMDCSRPGSSVYGDPPGKKTGVGYYVLLQRIFWLRGRTCIFCTAGRFFTDEPLGKPKWRGLGSYSSLFPQIQCLEHRRWSLSVWHIPGSQLKAGETVENKRWRTTAQARVLKCPGDPSLQKLPEPSPGWAGVWRQWRLLFCPSHSIPSSGS